MPHGPSQINFLQEMSIGPWPNFTIMLTFNTNSTVDNNYNNNNNDDDDDTWTSSNMVYNIINNTSYNKYRKNRIILFW